MLDRELIFLNFEADDREDLLSRLSDILYEKGYVKQSFKQAILEREKVFPTGLPTLGVKVALPHTDTEHVIKPAILISTLKEPVVFKEMGNGVNDIDVGIVFLLAVKNPAYQVKLLRKLINMFSKENILLSLKECKNAQCIYDILKRELY